MTRPRNLLRYVAAVVLAIGAFTGAALSTSFAFGEIGKRQDRARDTVMAAFAQQAAYVALIDEESGVRGYVATGDPVFLQPYHHGRAAYAAYRASRAVTVDRADGGVLTAFGRSGDDVQPYFLNQIAAVAAGKRDRAVRNLPEGRLRFARVRKSNAAAANELQAALGSDRAHIRRAVAVARTAMLAMALVLVLAGWFSTILAIRASRSARLARRDELTELPNRRAFEERLSAMLAARRPDELLAVLYVDLDEFKPVNDRLGHAAGDKVLTAFGERLRRAVRPEDFVARLGGDEFVALLSSIASTEVAYTIAERIAHATDEPLTVAGTEVRLSASIGVAVVPEDGMEPRDVVRSADEAMYRVKRSKRAVAGGALLGSAP
ncbi:MAG: diguanylate cyclase [Candidatus Elarobacter sp.]